MMSSGRVTIQVRNDIQLDTRGSRKPCRLPGSGQVQCTSWRNFAPFSSSTFKTIHGEQAGKRDRGGSAVGALEAHSARTRHNTTCIKPGYKTRARLLPLESSARGCSGSKCFCAPGLPSKGGARALHHQPRLSIDLDHALPLLSSSHWLLDHWQLQYGKLKVD
jgi:hypothetical protein